MKIVKKASLVWSSNQTCKKCGTELLIETGDLRYGKFYSGMDAQLSLDFYVECPVCKEVIFLSEKSIPNPVKHHVKAKEVFEK